MIAAEPQTRHTAAVPDWQRQLAEAVRDPLELLALLELTPAQLGPGVAAASLAAAAQDFPLRVPHAFIARMRRGDPRDPLLLQVLAQPIELEPAAGFVADPLEETTARDAPGLLRKYAGRALLIATGACAVHCRYCFRRHYDYGADNADGPRWGAALDAIAADPSIEEVILSGGDPLSLGNPRLAQLFARLAQMPQLRRVRIHTRTPIVLPARVDAGLLGLLAPWRERLVIVVHANHPAEIDAPTADALRQLAGCSAALLNQSVLLAGVNDDAQRAGRALAAPVHGRRAALLPAPAGPGRRCGAFRGWRRTGTGAAPSAQRQPAGLPGAAPGARDPGAPAKLPLLA